MCARRAAGGELGLPVVATHPVQFLEPDDFEAHEARVCVAEGETLANPGGQALHARAVLQDPGADGGAVCRPAQRAGQHVEIAQRCNLTLVLGKPQLPDFPTPLPTARACRWRRLLPPGQLRGPGAAPGSAVPRRGRRDGAAALCRAAGVRDRHHREDGLPRLLPDRGRLHRLGQGQRLPGGAGRGSGAGSLVAYALFITDLDPLRYNLLFERFLNPERVSMPDFDIDFCQGNRDRVIDYVKDKYGRDAVSQIATFGTMAAKAALRDVGRVLGMGYGHVDSIAKLIPAPPGKTVTLARCPTKPDPASSTRARKRPTGAARGRRGRGGRAAGAGHAGRRHRAQHRHACRRRADRAGQDHRLLPAVPAARQRQRGQPVRQGRRRGHRPGEVRLPGPGHADHPGAGQGLHPRAPPGARGLRLRDLPLDDPRSTSCSPTA
jgi:hypothetical protein